MGDADRMVAASSEPIRTAMASVPTWLRSSLPCDQLILSQQPPKQDAEDKQRTDGLDKGKGYVHRSLDVLAADGQKGQEHRTHGHADRFKPAEQRRSDRRETVA